MRTKTASKLSDTQTIWMGPRVPERVQKTGSALVSSMSGIEIQRMNRCDWVFAHSLHPVLTRDSAVELNLWLKRTCGRIGCILGYSKELIGHSEEESLSRIYKLLLEPGRPLGLRGSAGSQLERV